MTICYFLEDIAHERFLKALVARLAEEQGISPDRLIHDVRNAFKHFVEDLRTAFSSHLSSAHPNHRTME